MAEAGTSMSWGDRVTPVRAGDLRDFDGVDADSLDESALSVDGDESAGAAHAVPPPLMAAPTPSATAKPPTRPTNADAPNWLAPLISRRPHASANASSQIDSLKRKQRMSLIACASNTLFHRNNAEAGELLDCSESTFATGSILHPHGAAEHMIGPAGNLA